MKADSQSDGLVLVINFDKNISAANQGELESEIQLAIKSETVINLVFDLKSKFLISTQSLRSLSTLSLKMREKGKFIFILNPHKDLKYQIIDLGLSTLFKPIASLDAIPAENLQPKGKSMSLNAEFVNVFLAGAIETLKVQCHTECKPLKPIVKEDRHNNLYTIDIAGVVGITSSQFKGSIAICFPASSFLKIMTSMVGEECKEITKEIEDGAGELINIIFGYGKRILNQNGQSVEMALPSIVRGQLVRISQSAADPTLLIPFETNQGPFHIEITLQNQENKSAA